LSVLGPLILITIADW